VVQIAPFGALTQLSEIVNGDQVKPTLVELNHMGTEAMPESPRFRERRSFAGKDAMTIAELTAAAATLRQIEAQITALRGAFLMAGDIAFARQPNDVGILVSDLLIQGVEREIAAKQSKP